MIIISHQDAIIAAEKLLTCSAFSGQIKYSGELESFVVYEKLKTGKYWSDI